MKAVPFCGEQEAWDSFVQQSGDGWFWHTSSWMDYSKEYSGDRFIANRSFWVKENGEPLALCPVFIETGGAGQESHQFSYSGGPLPIPCMRTGLPDRQRTRALGFYLETLESLAAANDVGYLQVRVPALAPSYLEHGGPFANPMLRFGHTDLPFLTQVIDLHKDLKSLWADLRKGHKADAKRAGQSCTTVVWDRNSITAEKFSDYQQLHAKDAGRVTRSQRTFDLMYQWIKQGNAVLAEAQHTGRPAAFALVVLFGNGASYGSACKDPDSGDIPASHGIQWNVITWLKEQGYRWYDVGLQQYARQFSDLASPKDISISAYKRGFGGNAVPVVTSEYFYSQELLRRTYENRLREYLSAKMAVPVSP